MLTRDTPRLQKPTQVRSEAAAEHAITEAIHEAAFGGRREADVVRSMHQLGRYSRELSLVAEQTDRVVGHAMFSHVGLQGSDRRVRRVTVLAPLAVDPNRQRQGIGAALVRRGLDLLESQGEPLVIVRGDLQYYGRFGFEPSAAFGIEPPFRVAEDHYLVKRLRTYDPSYRGVVRYPSTFASVGYPVEWSETPDLDRDGS
jgi:putative acetyltransferase